MPNREFGGRWSELWSAGSPKAGDVEADRFRGQVCETAGGDENAVMVGKGEGSVPRRHGSRVLSWGSRRVWSFSVGGILVRKGLS